MLFRIGINVDDVMVEGQDILGDGVNVAARVEALAEPGGICISRTARDQVRDKLGLPFEDMGEVEVKNIARPVRVFRILTDEQKGAMPRKKTARPASWRLAVLVTALVVIAAGAWTHLQEVFLRWSNRPAESLKSAFVSAQRAVALDDSDSQAHWALGAVYTFMRQHDRALAAYQRALTLNPNNADNLAHYGGFALVYAGLPEEDIVAVREAKRLNPHYPWWYAYGLGQAYFAARRYDEAIEAWRDKTAPAASSPSFLIAAAHAQAGRLDEARAIMDKFRQADPGATVSGIAAGQPYKKPADLQHLRDGLKKAGLPE